MNKDDEKEKIDFLILSDIHGWFDIPMNLKKGVLFLDSRELGEVDPNGEVHNEFIKEGIDKAAEKLASYQAKTVIGLSIGGVIAWRAVLRGMQVDKLIGISATRLRFETNKPDCDIELFYGENDEFAPKKEWFSAFGLNYTIIAGGNHNIYKKPQFLNL